MHRRSFLTLLGGAATAWPMAAGAQQRERVQRVVLTSNENSPRNRSFVQAMRQAGWTDGRNVRFEYRALGTEPDRMRDIISEVVASGPDVIVTNSTLATSLTGQMTKTIPIVMSGAGDAPSVGLVGSMARPSGNITGFTAYELSLGGKWLGLLKEAAPHLTRFALVYTPGGPSSEAVLRAVEELAPIAGAQTTAIPAINAQEIEHAVDTFARTPEGGVMVLPGPATAAHAGLLIALALKHRLPTIYFALDYVPAGGMMAYAADLIDVIRRSASYVDRILRGEKPGDLPIQAPTAYKLVVNLKAAKAIGLTIPETFLVRADEVIE